MLYQGIIGGGSSPVEPVEPVDLSPVLLWTNPSLSGDFAAQKVSVDLTDYVGAIIEYTSRSAASITSRAFVKKSDALNTLFGSGYYDGGNGHGRNITAIDDSGITFGNNYYSSTENNGFVKPYKIYGVKEYVVEPALANIPFIRTTTDRGSTTEEQITATFDVTAFNNVDIESYLVKSNPTYGMYVIYKDDTVVVREVADSTVHNNLHIDVSNNTKLKIVGYLNSSVASDLVKFELTNILFS